MKTQGQDASSTGIPMPGNFLNELNSGRHRPILRPPPFELRASENASLRGGQLLVETVCRRFAVWRKLDDVIPVESGSPVLDRARVAQLLFSLTTGGTLLDDVEALRKDPMLLNMLGLENMAGKEALANWLASRTEADLDRLRRANSDLVTQAILEYRDNQPPGPIFDVIFNRTRLAEAHLSWDTLSIGPFLLDGCCVSTLENPAASAASLPSLLRKHVSFWKEIRTWFCASDPPAIADQIEIIADSGFTCWTVDIRRRSATVGQGWPASKRKPAHPSWPERYRLWPIPSSEVPPPTPAPAAPLEKRSSLQPYLVTSDCRDHEFNGLLRGHQLIQARPQIVRRIQDDFHLSRLPVPGIIPAAVLLTVATLAYNIVAYLLWAVFPAQYESWTTAEVIANLLNAPVFLLRKRKLYIYLPDEILAPCREFIAASIPRRKRWKPAAAESLFARDVLWKTLSATDAPTATPTAPAGPTEAATSEPSRKHGKLNPRESFRPPA